MTTQDQQLLTFQPSAMEDFANLYQAVIDTPEDDAAQYILLRHIYKYNIIDQYDIVIKYGNRLIDRYNPVDNWQLVSVFSFIGTLYTTLIKPSVIRDNIYDIIEQTCIAAIHVHDYTTRNRCFKLLQQIFGTTSCRVKLILGQIQESAENYNAALKIYAEVIARNPGNELVLFAKKRVITIIGLLLQTVQVSLINPIRVPNPEVINTALCDTSNLDNEEGGGDDNGSIFVRKKEHDCHHNNCKNNNCSSHQNDGELSDTEQEDNCEGNDDNNNDSTGSGNNNNTKFLTLTTNQQLHTYYLTILNSFTLMYSHDYDGWYKLYEYYYAVRGDYEYASIIAANFILLEPSNYVSYIYIADAMLTYSKTCLIPKLQSKYRKFVRLGGYCTQQQRSQQQQEDNQTNNNNIEKLLEKINILTVTLYQHLIQSRQYYAMSIDLCSLNNNQHGLMGLYDCCKVLNNMFYKLSTTTTTTTTTISQQQQQSINNTKNNKNNTKYSSAIINDMLLQHCQKVVIPTYLNTNNNNNEKNNNNNLSDTKTDRSSLSLLLHECIQDNNKLLLLSLQHLSLQSKDKFEQHQKQEAQQQQSLLQTNTTNGSNTTTNTNSNSNNVTPALNMFDLKTVVIHYNNIDNQTLDLTYNNTDSGKGLEHHVEQILANINNPHSDENSNIDNINNNQQHFVNLVDIHHYQSCLPSEMLLAPGSPSPNDSDDKKNNNSNNHDQFVDDDRDDDDDVNNVNYEEQFAAKKSKPVLPSKPLLSPNKQQQQRQQSSANNKNKSKKQD